MLERLTIWLAPLRSRPRGRAPRRRPTPTSPLAPARSTSATARRHPPPVVVERVRLDRVRLVAATPDRPVRGGPVGREAAGGTWVEKNSPSLGHIRTRTACRPGLRSSENSMPRGASHGMLPACQRIGNTRRPTCARACCRGSCGRLACSARCAAPSDAQGARPAAPRSLTRPAPRTTHGDGRFHRPIAHHADRRRANNLASSRAHLMRGGGIFFSTALPQNV